MRRHASENAVPPKSCVAISSATATKNSSPAGNYPYPRRPGSLGFRAQRDLGSHREWGDYEIRTVATPRFPGMRACTSDPSPLPHVESTDKLGDSQQPDSARGVTA